MPASPLPHQRLFTQADGWFHRASAALLSSLPCQRGCHRCCIGPFSITGLDVAALQQGLASLPPSVRQEIQDYARRQAAEIETAFPRLGASHPLTGWTDSQVDQVVERFANLPCPALDPEGSCRVYPFRPLTCRTMGIPLEEDGLMHGACEIQVAIPVRRLPQALRKEEDRLAAIESREMEIATTRAHGHSPVRPADEVLLPYGFLEAPASTSSGGETDSRQHSKGCDKVTPASLNGCACSSAG